MPSKWSTCLRSTQSKRFREAGASIGQFGRWKDCGVVRLTIHETGAVIEGAGPRTTAFGQSCRSAAGGRAAALNLEETLRFPTTALQRSRSFDASDVDVSSGRGN